MLENVNINLALMVGLWIVTISTVPIWWLWKMQQRKRCSHDFQNYRVCPDCGLKEKAIESPKPITEEIKATTEKILEETA